MFYTTSINVIGIQLISNWQKSRLSLWFFVFVLCVLHNAAFSQKTDSTLSVKHFGGAVTVTNNGISLLPAFSLGRPAVMFDMNVGDKKLTFEPQFRFALEGKPWAFLFWWRYKLVRHDKFKLNIGANPSVAFRAVKDTLNGITTETIVPQQYFGTEIAPSYFLSKTISVGLYYLHSNGLGSGTINSTHFITINSNFSNIRLSEQFYMKFSPQFFYLKMDSKDGFYATATVSLAKRNFPISIQSIYNHTIQSDIAGAKAYLWNVSLIYAFSREYVAK